MGHALAMLRILFTLQFLVGALLFPSCSSSPKQSEPVRVLLLGDSISIGYHSAVREALGPDYLVVRPMANPDKGRAENCEGTTKGVKAIDRWLALEGGGWDVIHFNFGLHDLKRVDPDTRKNSTDPADPNQADLATYTRQLREIAEALCSTEAHVVFATTTPVPTGGVRPHRDPEDVELYNAAARRVVEPLGIAVNDLFALALPRLEELQKPVDVHFTAEGSAALGAEVARAVRSAAKQ